MYLRDIFLPLLIATSLGSVFGIYYSHGLVYYLVCIFVSIIAVIKLIKSKHKNTLVVFLSLTMFLIGGVWGEYFRNADYSKKIFDSSVGTYSYFEGVVDNNPDEKKGGQSFVLKIDKTRIEARSPIAPALSYGDKIKVYGKLSQGEDFESTNGKVVRYSALLRSRDISYLLEIKRFEILARKDGNFILENIYSLKNNIKEIIYTTPAPESNLLFSMVFGGKSSLPENIIDYFKIAGLLHIIVLSGQNLTIVSYIALLVFSRTLGFRYGHLIAIVFIMAYAIMGGLEAATLRAALMSIILIVASMLGRSANAGRVLLFTSSLMIINNPFILFDDPSFQLSVLAFSGIIYLSPIIERMLIIRNISPKMSGYLSAIFGAQIAVLPYLLYSTQTFTPYSFLANFLSLFVVGVITVCGMIFSIIGLFSIQIFKVISIPLTFVLNYIIRVAEFISKLPYSSVEVGTSLSFVAVIYIFLIYYIYKSWNKEHMSPLSIFTIKNNYKIISKGNIPWVDEGGTHALTSENTNENKVINW